MDTLEQVARIVDPQAWIRAQGWHEIADESGEHWRCRAHQATADSIAKAEQIVALFAAEVEKEGRE